MKRKTIIIPLALLALLLIAGCTQPVCLEWKPHYECLTPVECPNEVHYRIPYNYTGNLSRLDITLPAGCEITKEIKVNVSEASVTEIEQETFINVVGEEILLYETPPENCTPRTEILKCERWSY